MIRHETTTVTNVQQGMTETRDVLDSSQTAQRWEFLTRVWLRRSWSMTFLPPLYFIFHEWALGVSSMMVALLNISFWATHLTIVWIALLLYGKHLARLHMGSFNSDFYTDSVMTLQSWSTIRQDWGMRVASEKEQTIIRLIQSIPLDGICGDYCRLDILLEDYLMSCQCHHMNHTAYTISQLSSTYVTRF